MNINNRYHRNQNCFYCNERLEYDGPYRRYCRENDDHTLIIAVADDNYIEFIEIFLYNYNDEHWHIFCDYDESYLSVRYNKEVLTIPFFEVDFSDVDKLIKKVKCYSNFS